MLKFVSGLPLVSKAGIAPNNALVWILFSDTGRKFLFLNNDFLEAPGSSAATSAAVRGAEPNPQTVSFKPTALKATSVSALDASPVTELPISNKVRTLNGMGAGVSTANANLSDWLIGKQGYVSSGGDMSLNSLRTIGGDGVLYIGSHGGSMTRTIPLSTSGQPRPPMTARPWLPTTPTQAVLTPFSRTTSRTIASPECWRKIPSIPPPRNS
jgi:hypothetical protein